MLRPVALADRRAYRAASQGEFHDAALPLPNSDKPPLLPRQDMNARALGFGTGSPGYTAERAAITSRIITAQESVERVAMIVIAHRRRTLRFAY